MDPTFLTYIKYVCKQMVNYNSCRNKVVEKFNEEYKVSLFVRAKLIAPLFKCESTEIERFV